MSRGMNIEVNRQHSGSMFTMNGAFVPMRSCLFCGGTAEESQGSDHYEIDCGNCGRVDVTGTAYSMLETKEREIRVAALDKARRWSRGKIPEVTSQCV